MRTATRQVGQDQGPGWHKLNYSLEVDHSEADRAISVADSYMDAVADSIVNQPRSLQKRIGPSEIGMQCNVALLHKLAGSDEPARTNPYPWKPTVGTAVHDYLERAFDRVGKQGLYPGRYLTERKVTVGEVGGQAITGSTDLYDTIERAVIDHKGLPLDTPIPTPTGWKLQGDLKVGDTIFGRDGKPTKVTKVYPVQNRDCYRITFDDKTSIVTDDVQLLTVKPATRKEEITASVKELADMVHSPHARPQRWLQLHNTAPLDLPEADLVVPPYVLGAWLGDGSTRGGQIHKPDQEVFDIIESYGYKVGPVSPDGLTRAVHGLTGDLQKLGLQKRRDGRVYWGEKRIPEQYLRGSFQQRLDLLRGLMDTDGSWNKIRKQAIFCTTRKALAEGVAELVYSLGWKARIFEYEATGFDKTVQAYDVTFVPFDHNPFKLSRKADLVRIEGSRLAKYRIIYSIEPVETVPTRCIDVSAEDHMYLAFDRMIPVHNCVGKSTLTKAKRSGASPQYRIQAHLYGKGWEDSGMKPELVMVAFLPRDGELSDAWFWSEPYNRQVAENALAHLNELHDELTMFGLEVALQVHAKDDCNEPFCAWHNKGYQNQGKAPHAPNPTTVSQIFA